MQKSALNDVKSSLFVESGGVVKYVCSDLGLKYKAAVLEMTENINRFIPFDPTKGQSSAASVCSHFSIENFVGLH